MTFKVEGLKELERALQELPQRVGKGVLSRSLKKASEPIAELANMNAPVGLTGEYATSFSYSTRLNKRQGRMHRRMFRDERASVEGFVGTNDPAGVQQEFGNVHHAPQPALRPAWDAESRATLQRLSKILWEEIEKSRIRQQRQLPRG